MLLGLKEYPNMNKRQAFQRWYLTTSTTGEQLMLKLANNLVLHTNINKTTAFYRLLHPIKGKKIKNIPPRTKRMTTMIYLYTRLYFERQLKDAFDHIKAQSSSKFKKAQIIQLLEYNLKNKRMQAFLIWLKKSQKSRR